MQWRGWLWFRFRWTVKEKNSKINIATCDKWLVSIILDFDHRMQCITYSTHWFTALQLSFNALLSFMGYWHWKRKWTWWGNMEKWCGKATRCVDDLKLKGPNWGSLHVKQKKYEKHKKKNRKVLSNQHTYIPVFKFQISITLIKSWINPIIT